MKTRRLQFKRAALFVLLLTLTKMTNTFAQEFTVGNLEYSIQEEGGGVEVIGYVEGLEGKLVIPEMVSYNGAKYSVTSIGTGAFEGCRSVSSVTIPKSVIHIGANPFRGCRGLTHINVESGNMAYDSREGCNAIIEKSTNTLVTGCKNSFIPNSVKIIGHGSFYECSGITNITIPNSVTSIENYAFYQCENLASISIPNSVTSIGKHAFCQCNELTSVAIPNSVTSIKDGTFYECKNLASVSIPNSVTTIGNYAFEGCKKLVSVTIPNSVTSIEEDAFNYCEGLSSVVIETQYLQNISFDKYFKGCNNLHESNIIYR